MGKSTKTKLAEFKKRSILGRKRSGTYLWEKLTTTRSTSAQNTGSGPCDESGRGEKIQDHEGVNSTEKWKAMRGGWSGSKKGFWVVIVVQADDREMWINNQQTCSRVGSKNGHGRVLTEVLDVLFRQSTQVGKSQRMHQSNSKRQRNQRPLKTMKCKKERQKQEMWTTHKLVLWM